ncbi:MAG TPA: DUF6799 domain-containing protein [Chthoniobacteraceae bacterium]|jgi:shikimate kinase|nr:hypothetical protein [Chthoniobacter sp.]HEV7868933.1 DUF6799 domain-containing protein [Chthoniobacteraceae bacterium]
MKTTCLNFTALAAVGLLSFSAVSLAQTTATPTQPTTTSPAADPAVGDVGLSARDGITMSGADAFITRNGVTEKLAKEVVLDGGVRVQPNGTVTMKDKTKITLRANQLLTLDGRLVEAPVNATGAATGPR